MTLCVTLDSNDTVNKYNRIIEYLRVKTETFHIEIKLNLALVRPRLLLLYQDRLQN